MRHSEENGEYLDTMSETENAGIMLLPLTIGVTGHRDLREEDREQLEAQVQQIFVDLKRDCPKTPLMLLSSLAEGADRLVARVALANGVRLIVPLPLPQSLYEEDFQTQASRDEFNTLLQQAERCFELPLLQGACEEDVREQGLARDHQYAQVGAYIVLHSQVLIALWDGTFTSQVGGTSQIGQFKLQGVIEPYAVPRHHLDEVESGPVYHIVTPRVKNPTPVGPNFAIRKLFSASELPDTGSHEHDISNDRMSDEKKPQVAAREFQRILKHLDTFNRDIINHCSSLEKKREESTAYLFNGLDTAVLPGTLRTTLDRYSNIYATADTLAIYFRDRTVNTLLLLFTLFFAAVFCLDIYAHLGNQLIEYLPGDLGIWLKTCFLFFYLVLLFIAYYIWYSRITKQDYKNKHLDYRALAEGLRVQFFWRLAGLPDTVVDHYLHKQRSELDWIRNGIRVANLLCDSSYEQHSANAPADASDGRYHLILQHWVDNQQSYFTKAAQRDHAKLKANERWVNWFFIAGIILVLALFILQLLQLSFISGEWLHNELFIELLIVLSGLTLVITAMKEGYGDKMAYNEQIRQYQRMTHLFQHSHKRLKMAIIHEKRETAEHVVRELGEEALAENGDWVMLHRARPFNVPKGG